MIEALNNLTEAFGLWPGIAIGEFVLLCLMYQRTVPRDVYQASCDEKATLIEALNALAPTTEKLFEFVKLLVARDQ